MSTERLTGMTEDEYEAFAAPLRELVAGWIVVALEGSDEQVGCGRGDDGVAVGDDRGHG